MAEKLTYKHWKTGKRETYTLGEIQNQTEQICKTLQCPFDKTPLLGVRDNLQGWRWYNCPNCQRDYSMSTNTQEDLQKQFDIQIRRERDKLAELASRPGI